MSATILLHTFATYYHRSVLDYSGVTTLQKKVLSVITVKSEAGKLYLSRDLH